MDHGSNVVGIIAVCIIGAIYVIASVYSLFWVMRDAESRGKSGCLVVLLLVFLHIPGMIAWLIFRPEKKIESGDQH